MKAKIIDGKVYRCRRGKRVEIPPEWIGRFTSDQAKKKRLKENRAYNAGSTKVPWKLSAPTSGEDAQHVPGHRRAWITRRKMKPEPVMSRQERDRHVIKEELDGEEG